MNITKLELCNRVAKRVSELSASSLKPVIETFLDEILSVLSEGKRIEIRGFGSFKTKSRKTRIGRNPRTGDSVQIPAHTLPAFKFSRDAVKIFSDKIGGKKQSKLVKNEVLEPVKNIINKSAESFVV